jgi:peptide-methionine (S)-S-oxide reductase
MKKRQKAVFAGGCFWCFEALFQRLKGVISVTSGYTGGEVENPTYQQVCVGDTGHAEAVQIEFDSNIISFEKLLDIFWHLHDPTAKNRQGNDVGTQYRSAVFYVDDTQKKETLRSKKELEKLHYYSSPIVTEIVPLKKFYKAEDYHKDYYENNQTAPYCTYIIEPKIRKLVKDYNIDLKENEKLIR